MENEFFAANYESPIGSMLLQCDEKALVSARFADAGLEYKPENPILQAARQWLDDYFAGLRPQPHKLPLKFDGTVFRISVWKKLLEIEYGETMSYSALAKGIPTASGNLCCSRAIGTAVGKNPFHIIAPCHRVIKKNGEVGNFAAGSDRKLWLLRHEGCDL